MVVTRFNEDLAWIDNYLTRPNWNLSLYLTAPEAESPTPELCKRTKVVTCTRIPNAGYEWAGYLAHMQTRYHTLADRTIFLQGDPFAVSPDIHCILNRTHRFHPIQVLSWVQQQKKKIPIFRRCRVSNLGPCKIYVEPVTSGYRPMLHGDMWLHKACRMAKRFKGSLFNFMQSQLGADPKQAAGTPRQHLGLMRRQKMPKNLYRSYGSQFSATRHQLQRKSPRFWDRLHTFATVESNQINKHGFLPIWRSQTSKERAMLLEISWMGLLQAERFIRKDICAACLASARKFKLEKGAIGPSCDADYTFGAPRVEVCNITGSGRASSAAKRLNVNCPVTKNDHERKKKK